MSNRSMFHGVFVADKPRGITSHDVVDQARRIFGQRRVGHAGTLDPIATGVLVLLLGKATRLSRFLTAGEKEYRGVVRLGWATTTDDVEGEPLGDPRPVSFADEDLEKAARSLTGRIDQLPPIYSAKKHQGEPAYQLARREENVERESVEVDIYSMELVREGEDRIEFHTRCAAGTYARSIARDLGEMLGCGGHLEQLTRVRSGSFGLDEAHRLDEMEDREEAEDHAVAFDEIPLPYPDVTVSLEEAEKISNGTPVASAGRVRPIEGHPPEWVRLRDPEGRFLALADLDGPFLRPRVVFPD